MLNASHIWRGRPSSAEDEAMLQRKTMLAVAVGSVLAVVVAAGALGSQGKGLSAQGTSWGEDVEGQWQHEWLPSEGVAEGTEQELGDPYQPSTAEEGRIAARWLPSESLAVARSADPPQRPCVPGASD